MHSTARQVPVYVAKQPSTGAIAKAVLQGRSVRSYRGLQGRLLRVGAGDVGPTAPILSTA